MSNIDERTGKPKIILHLCAKTGSDSQRYADMGYDRRIIGEEIGVENYTPPPYVYGIISNPVCTEFSLAMTTRPRDLRKGMILVNHCLRIVWECLYDCENRRYPNLKFWVMENPGKGFMKWFMGNPVFTYNHYEYGETVSKTTSLWGMFNPPIRPLLFNQIQKGFTMKDKFNPAKMGRNFKEISELRSKCPYSFATAFFESNQ